MEPREYPSITLKSTPPRKALAVFLITVRLFIIIPLFILSLVFYLIGLVLCLTLVGAVAGLPIVLATYAFDALLLAFAVNPRATIKKVECPLCFKGRFIITDIYESFKCKGCKEEIGINKADK